MDIYCSWTTVHHEATYFEANIIDALMFDCSVTYRQIAPHPMQTQSHLQITIKLVDSIGF